MPYGRLFWAVSPSPRGAYACSLPLGALWWKRSKNLSCLTASCGLTTACGPKWEVLHEHPRFCRHPDFQRQEWPFPKHTDPWPNWTPTRLCAGVRVCPAHDVQRAAPAVYRLTFPAGTIFSLCQGHIRCFASTAWLCFTCFAVVGMDYCDFHVCCVCIFPHLFSH